MNGTFAEDLDSNTKNGIEMKEMEMRKDILKPRRKYPGFRKNFKYYLQEFTDYTGIHGFKYMGEQDRSVFERLWWIILFCISLYVCIDQIFKTWMKWDASPVLVSFARSPTPVWQIPFPAITICSETKSRQRKYNFTEAYKQFVMGNNMTDDELKKFSDSSLICDNHLYTRGEKYTELETIKYLMSIGPQFEDVFFTCKWTSMNESCYNMFYPMLTEDGMCFTFNMLDRSELFRKKVFMEGEYMQHGRESEGWTLENGYPKDAPMETFPRRALSAGSSAGLNLVLMAWLPDLDYVCKGPVQGFKVLYGKIFLLIQPTVSIDENTTRICGSGSQECMFEAKQELLIREVEYGISNYESERSSSSPDCDCLPACTSLTYNAEYSQGHYEWEKLFQAFRVNFSEFPGVQMTRLTIFFKEQQFITSERNELYGQTDFLANCGGILGLFTGFSVLSIIEIIYFLSLRLMCNVNRHGRRYWSGSAKLLKDAKVND
nr:pickpocket protein 28-like [Leptinotarsa decemlineata]